MRDITAKTSSLRQAEAIGGVFCSPEILDIVKQGKLPKGEPFGMAESAALLASKQMHHLIPHCHPVVIDGLQVKFYFSDDDFIKKYVHQPKTGIYIWAKGKSVGHTGIEMEILTAILKLDKFDFWKKKVVKVIKALRKAVILGHFSAQTVGLISKIFKQKDIEILAKIELENQLELQQNILQQIDNQIPLVLICHKKNDALTPFLKKIFDRKLEGMTQAMYHHGFKRSPISIHTDLVAGIKNKSIIISLPNEAILVRESLEAVISSIFEPLLIQDII